MKIKALSLVVAAHIGVDAPTIAQRVRQRQPWRKLLNRVTHGVRVVIDVGSQAQRYDQALLHEAFAYLPKCSVLIEIQTTIVIDCKNGIGSLSLLYIGLSSPPVMPVPL